jgi:membrane-associated protein
MLADLMNAATAFVDWLSTLDQWTVLLFTFLTSAVEMTFLAGLLVPGESVVMLAGSLPQSPAGFAAVLVVGTLGALAGQCLGYAVGRVFGPRLRSTRLGLRIGAERFDKAEEYLRSRGGSALVAVRFVAVIHAVVPIVAGVVRMPFRRFLLWSALGTTLWVGAFAGVGALTAGADATGGLGLLLTAIGATCLGVVPFLGRLLRRRLVPSGTASAAPAGAVAPATSAGPVALATSAGPVAPAASAGPVALAAPAVQAGPVAPAGGRPLVFGPFPVGVVRVLPDHRPADVELGRHPVKLLQAA